MASCATHRTASASAPILARRSASAPHARDDEVVFDTALRVPLDHLHMVHETDHLRLDADLLAKFPQGGLAQRLAGFDEAARQTEKPSSGGRPRAARSTQPSRNTAAEAARMGRDG
jgi:hypothetical protein